MSGETQPGRTPPQWAIAVRDSTEQDGWLLVYLDVMTLLVVMFVVMLTFAGEGEPVETSAAPTDTAPVAQEQGTRAEALWMEGSLGKEVEITRSAAGVRLRISSGILFESGRAQLSHKGLETLADLVPALKRSPHAIIVTGHTDNLPITTERFPSNWELSSARAAQVVRFFQKEGIAPDRMTAVGKAHTQPRASNDTALGRSRNRRVELLLRLPGVSPSDVQDLPVD